MRKEAHNESLSALLDGECSAAELDVLLDEIERSPELAREWSRQCLARESAEGIRVARDQRCICEGVMNALDAPPAQAAPARANVIDFAARRLARHPRVAALWKPALGFAAAASMGAAAVLLVQPAADPVEGPNLYGSGQLAGWTPAGSALLKPVGALERDDAHAQMLREYLMDHSSAIAGEGMGGTLRYARFAAHTADYQPQSETESGPAGTP